MKKNKEIGHAMLHIEISQYISVTDMKIVYQTINFQDIESTV